MILTLSYRITSLHQLQIFNVFTPGSSTQQMRLIQPFQRHGDLHSSSHQVSNRGSPLPSQLAKINILYPFRASAAWNQHRRSKITSTYGSNIRNCDSLRVPPHLGISFGVNAHGTQRLRCKRFLSWAAQLANNLEI